MMVVCNDPPSASLHGLHPPSASLHGLHPTSASLHGLHPPHKCVTGCASTYNTARRLSKAMNQLNIGVIKEAQEGDDANGREETDLSPEEDLALKNQYQGERRRSSFCLKKLAPPRPDPVEGTYKLIGCGNYEKFLQMIGTGPLSLNMVMRASVVLTIMQEVDKRWKISTETAIKAKSIKGYKTYNRKLTENKFSLDDPQPELLEDWDQRIVTTTLNRGDGGNSIKLHQEAEKDQKHCKDSTIIIEVDEEDDDILNATYLIEDVKAWRKFRRHVNFAAGGAGGRRHSIC